LSGKNILDSGNICTTHNQQLHWDVLQRWWLNLFTLPLFVYPHFLCTTCVASCLFVQWKRCGWGVMSRSYFTSCPSENTTFRQTRTRQKRPKNLANTFSDALVKLHFFGQNFFCRWQIPLAVTSSTWQTSQLGKLTCQVDFSPCPLAPLQITWQVITC